MESENGESSPPWRESPYKTKAIADKKRSIAFHHFWGFFSISTDMDAQTVEIQITNYYIWIKPFVTPGKDKPSIFLFSLVETTDNGKDWMVKL